MTPTTFGSGPYQPAIAIDNYLWVHADTYKNDADAFVTAQAIVQAIRDTAAKILRENGYQRLD